ERSFGGGRSASMQRAHRACHQRIAQSQTTTWVEPPLLDLLRSERTEHRFEIAFSNPDRLLGGQANGGKPTEPDPGANRLGMDAVIRCRTLDGVQAARWSLF